MIDLDSLAEKRAKSLNQKEEIWRKAVWSPTFQRLSQNMSDGEVETFVTLCPSVPHLEAAVKFLSECPAPTDSTPFSLLAEKAAASGLSVAEWIKVELIDGSGKTAPKT